MEIEAYQQDKETTLECNNPEGHTWVFFAYALDVVCGISAQAVVKNGGAMTLETNQS